MDDNLIDDWIDCEVFNIIEGDLIACPQCEMGVLLEDPGADTDSGAGTRAICDMCGAEYVIE